MSSSGSGGSSGLPPAPAGAGAVQFDDCSLASFLLSGLTALYKHSSRKHEQLRQQCVEVISKIKAEDKQRADKIAKG